MFCKSNVKLINGIKSGERSLKSCAKLYCEIWKEPPWNEDFWRINEVLEDMRLQFRKNSARAFFAKLNQEIIGFSWGYQVSRYEMGEIAATKWTRQEKTYFYIDELGVDSQFRQEGIGRILTERIMDGVTLPIALRTDCLAVEARKLYWKLGFREIGILDGKYPSRTYWILERNN